ncbi:MAG: hypothetical protein HOE62_14805 [Alphaproteobacteria bacterium]|jgi:hypothetical protein|nr:hypothetical protein [Alphaproteobacteria bacterium]MBT4967237.1 hypothetical protein [Alphaproteobacteria bacterium]MBT5160832.1 hypothetical protein [Alphaproteobacteria bacterium]MBT5917549.1 hypothetical protein [Alphaproteobacteria bacterium]
MSLSNDSLVLLHTAQSNVDLFSFLLAELAPEIPTRHLMRDDLLKAAFAEGVLTDTIRQQTSDLLYAQACDNAGLVVCTCSTIGPGADDAADKSVAEGLAAVLRIDRPMAEDAVRRADHLVVAATFKTTLTPTLDLVKQAAVEAGRTVTIEPCLIADGKRLFEAGDMDGYLPAIARGLEDAAKSTELIVLAQASMAPALDRLSAPRPFPFSAARAAASSVPSKSGVRSSLETLIFDCCLLNLFHRPLPCTPWRRCAVWPAFQKSDQTVLF